MKDAVQRGYLSSKARSPILEAITQFCQLLARRKVVHEIDKERTSKKTNIVDLGSEAHGVKVANEK